MRRNNTLCPGDDILPPFTPQKSKTFVNFTINPALQTDTKNCFIQSHFVVSKFIDDVLMKKCLQQMEKRQLPKLINQAMKQCDFYFSYQTWQIDPQGPYKQKVQQPSLQPDKQPQCIILDPLLTTTKTKTKLSLRNSLSLSSFTKYSHNNYDRSNKPLLLNNNSTDRKQSTISNTTTRPSRPKLTTSNDLNCIPLRFENGITPDITSRRTLEDFLREKKKSKDTNIGHKIPSLNEDSFKVISEVVPKSNFFTSTSTSKNFQLFNEHEKHEKHEKLPQISLRQELGMDYDGKAIQIKKFSNLSKPAHVLKMVCKLKQESNEIRSQYIRSKYLRPQQIKLKPINERKHTTNNMSSLTLRLNSQQDVKTLVQDGLYTNRIKFRYQAQNDGMI